MRQVNRIEVRGGSTGHQLTFALVPDLHNGPFEDVLPELKQVDAILIAGDLVNRHRHGYAQAKRFLEEAPLLAPTFYSIGNHERKFSEMEAVWPLVGKNGVELLDNRYVHFHGVILGGLSSHELHKPVDASFLGNMAAEKGFHLLMCHHPEYYSEYVKEHGIELTVSGHAHGGQVQLFGRGLYAPGQGLFPKLTNGFYEDGRLFVSRGMTNSAGVPRFHNPTELVILNLIY